MLQECKEQLKIEAVLSYRLDLVFTLNQQVQQLLGVHRGLPVVGHQPNQGCVPLVGNLGEGGAATAHQHLPDAVLKGLEGLIIHPQESLQAAGLESPVSATTVQQPVQAFVVCVIFYQSQSVALCGQDDKNREEAPLSQQPSPLRLSGQGRAQ